MKTAPSSLGLHFLCRVSFPTLCRACGFWLDTQFAPRSERVRVARAGRHWAPEGLGLLINVTQRPRPQRSPDRSEVSRFYFELGVSRSALQVYCF